MEKDTKVALEILGIIFVCVYLINGVYGLYHHMFTTPNFNEYECHLRISDTYGARASKNPCLKARGLKVDFSFFYFYCVNY
jgi:hypothetical protein